MRDLHFEASTGEQVLGGRINVNGESKERLRLRTLGKQNLEQDLSALFLVVLGALELLPTLDHVSNGGVIDFLDHDGNIKFVCFVKKERERVGVAFARAQKENYDVKRCGNGGSSLLFVEQRVGPPSTSKELVCAIKMTERLLDIFECELEKMFGTRFVYNTCVSHPL